ncbi:MAG: SpoIIE family protein phosphatase [Lachnospiraceae bacterium]|nr:SpoIIE family protein phosphatase [Lachnospiraceae bacterium]
MPVYFESRKNKRQINQDCHFYMEYRINHEALLRIFVIADGMGGLSKGERASGLAARKWILKLQTMTLSEEFLNKTLTEQIENLKRFSYRSVQEINDEVYQELTDEGIEGGTTLTVGILFWDTLILTNCGDSPAYLYQKDGNFLKLTRDQNVAEELVRQQKITRDSAIYEQKKHMLTDYIGKYRKSSPSVVSIEYQKGDILLMGSDGAFGNLKEEELKDLIYKGKTRLGELIGMIFRKAEEAGEEDNQTMIVYQEEEKQEEKKDAPKRKGLFWKRQAV